MPVLSEYRFTPKQRILSKHDYQKVFNQAQFRSGNKRLLLLAIQTELETGRLGLVVPKKHLRRAVDRNIVKRITRNTFRLRQSDFIGVDIVVLVKGKFNIKEIRTQATDDINILWDKLAQKIKRAKLEQTKQDHCTDDQ
ncbi:MAG: ribonuclease P protein component [Pseudomonadales bacterium]|nr:ribonuclease P protein component [Pseudomonadales bacterium]